MLSCGVCCLVLVCCVLFVIECLLLAVFWGVVVRCCLLSFLV